MQPKFIPLAGYREYPVAEMERRSADFYADVQRRRTVRHFSDRAVPREIIENCLRAAGTIRAERDARRTDVLRPRRPGGSCV
jgi:hypothetical protein